MASPTAPAVDVEAATAPIGFTLPLRMNGGHCRRHARHAMACVLERSHSGTCLPNPYFPGGRRRG